ncbi:hypothetical protein Pint_06956 [Pistacia integerrima]|uniref:Uncharacterized protein n=1 Tax=Pistacia integerrima TaxID=434235 RepID=A0ACC0XSZ5_9ROSI|nr:hypothetical protein Pint_06956 [Pistacia integerrima]
MNHVNLFYDCLSTFLIFHILPSHCNVYYNKSLMLCLVLNINHHTDCSVTYTFHWIKKKFCQKFVIIPEIP